MSNDLHTTTNDDGYDSIDEDAELELSCALHDLALRVKTFEENMKDRFHPVDDDDDDEITEDIPEMDGDAVDTGSRHFGLASPKKQQRQADCRAVRRRHRRRSSEKTSKQQADEDDDNDDDELYDVNGSDSDSDDRRDSGDDCDNDEGDAKQHRDVWNFHEQKEELSEMRHNIALLLQGIKAEAKALEAHELDDNNR